MELVSSECIILRNQDFGERDRLVTFLTPEAGRVRGIVKGSRKLTSRGVGSFEPFSRGLMHYVPKAAGGLVTIRKCDPLPPYLYLSGDYDAFLFAGYLSELVDLCPIETAEIEPLFALLTETLNALCERGSPRRLPLLRLRFELRFLELLGVQPHWRQCCSCGRDLLRPDPVDTATPSQVPSPMRAVSDLPHGFDPRQGGALCPDCQGQRRARIVLPPPALAFLDNWRAGVPGARPSRDTLAALEHAVSEHLGYHLERRPRSLKMLPSLDALDRD